MQHAVGAMAGGQQLSSPGSCLEHFRANPYIECNSRGQCHFFYDKYSYWLVNVAGNGNGNRNGGGGHEDDDDGGDDRPQFQPLVNGQTLNMTSDAQLMLKVGRCRVCVLGSRLSSTADSEEESPTTMMTASTPTTWSPS